MKIIFGISRYTNHSKPAALHIPKENTRYLEPLCGDKRRKTSVTYDYDNGEPTCNDCIRLFNLVN